MHCEIPRDILYEIILRAPDARTFRAIALCCREASMAARKAADVKMDEFKIKHITLRAEFYTLPNGNVHGQYIIYYDDDMKVYNVVRNYRNGVKHGLYLLWNQCGTLDVMKKYVNGRSIYLISLFSNGVIFKQKKKSDKLQFHFDRDDGKLARLVCRINGYDHGLCLNRYSVLYAYYGRIVEMPYKYDETPNDDPRCLEFLKTLESFKK